MAEQRRGRGRGRSVRRLAAIELSTGAGGTDLLPLPVKHERGEGWGEGWGEGFPSEANNPPLPGPLLPLMGLVFTHKSTRWTPRVLGLNELGPNPNPPNPKSETNSKYRKSKI